MRATVPFRRRPSVVERVLGKRRARVLRRRFGLVAVGFGLSLLKPRRPVAPMVVVGALVVLSATLAARI